MFAKNKTFIILVTVIALWSLFYGMYKYYFRSLLEGTLAPSLQVVSGFLNLGGIAFLVGGALSYTFQIRWLLIASALGSVICLLFGYLFGLDSMSGFGTITFFIGMFYSIWVISKNYLISTEIKKTGYSDTFVNAIATICFIVFIIGGSIGGSYLFQTQGLNNTGSLFLVGLLFVLIFLSVFLFYPSTKQTKASKLSIFKKSFTELIPNIKIILKKYLWVIVVAGLLLSIGTIVSQLAIDYSKTILGKTELESTFLLLYAAGGAIIGNFATMSLSNKRRLSFRMFVYAFAAILFVFPLLIDYFFAIKILTLFAGLLFGGSLNLVEGYLFLKFGEDDQKEYGSTSYGLFSNIIMFAMMFFSDMLYKASSVSVTYIVLGVLLVILGFVVKIMSKKSQTT